MAEPLPSSRVTTVLICDDQEEMRGMLGAVIDLIPDMRVVGEAADGEVAIEEAARVQPDVILLDLAMPVLSGLDALPRLREVAKDAKIIVFTGFAKEAVSDQVFALGADRYIEKGTGLETITAALESVAAGTTAVARAEAG
jgi:DNA-binding NarL/FixJ family response regulator